MTTEQAKMIAEVAMGIAMGKDIEFYDRCREKWFDNVATLRHIVDFINSGEVYRVKQEPEYVPFTYEDDLLGLKIQRKFSADKHFKWCKSNIIAQDGNFVFTNFVRCTYEELLDDFVILDGTPSGSPCGKVK